MAHIKDQCGKERSLFPRTFILCGLTSVENPYCLQQPHVAIPEHEENDISTLLSHHCLFTLMFRPTKQLEEVRMALASPALAILSKL